MCVLSAALVVGVAQGATDTTAPTAMPTQSPAANIRGWNNTDVTVTWHWTDNPGGSGIDTESCTTSSLATGEGNPVRLSATCRDIAGNTGSRIFQLRIDKTRPLISAPADQVVQATDVGGANAVYPPCIAGDANGPLVLGYSKASGSLFPIGTTTVRCTATDPAGNVSLPASFTVTVLAPQVIKGPFTCADGMLGAVTVVGSVTVPAGTTCALIGTQVKGMIRAVGSSGLWLDHVSVTGSVEIIGLTGLPTVPTGKTWNAICASTVIGTLQIGDSTAPIAVGDPVACTAGNAITGSVQAAGNNAAIRISRNTIAGTLQCSRNTPAATGTPGSNRAARKVGECAGL